MLCEKGDSGDFPEVLQSQSATPRLPPETTKEKENQKGSAVLRGESVSPGAQSPTPCPQKDPSHTWTGSPRPHHRSVTQAATLLRQQVLWGAGERAVQKRRWPCGGQISGPHSQVCHPQSPCGPLSPALPSICQIGTKASSVQPPGTSKLHWSEDNLYREATDRPIRM